MKQATEMNMRTEHQCNGVDVRRLFDTVAAVKEAPGLAKFKFRTKGTWIEGGHSRSRIHGFYGAGNEDRSRSAPFNHEMDEPPVLLGENRGANPVEYLLSGLSGCLTASLVYHAAARGIELDEVAADLEGTLDLRGFLGLDPEIKPGYESISVRFRIKADGVAREKLEELCRLAQERSPVFDTVTRAVPVTVTLAP